jgi:hypothetical protein
MPVVPQTPQCLKVRGRAKNMFLHTPIPESERKSKENGRTMKKK